MVLTKRKEKKLKAKELIKKPKNVGTCLSTLTIMENKV